MYGNCLKHDKFECATCLHSPGSCWKWDTKDSGQRQEFSTGMVRDIQTNKPRYDLCWKPLYRRWAELMQRGALKYGDNNWKKAATEEELNRFKASAERHLMQWLEGDKSEDHAAAIVFNIAGGEYVAERIQQNLLSKK